MGGNVDYTGGLVFESTIREATWAAAQCRKDGLIVFLNPQMKAEGWRDHVHFELAKLTSEKAVKELVYAGPEVRWASYVLGAFYLLRNRYPEKVNSGVSVFIRSEVPLNKGVSSSAAVEVAGRKAPAPSYVIPLQGVEISETCQWGGNINPRSPLRTSGQPASVAAVGAQVPP